MPRRDLCDGFVCFVLSTPQQCQTARREQSYIVRGGGAPSATAVVEVLRSARREGMGRKWIHGQREVMRTGKTFCDGVS
jgi:hypothetical protein